MVKKAKKILLVALSMVLVAMLFLTGASFIKPNTANAAGGTGNVQDYKDGKVKFEDRLWDTPNAIRVTDSTEFANALATETGVNGTSGLVPADFETNGCQAYFIDGATYNGQITKVFCYVGFPAGASASSKVPAMVLVHGGGGTAYSQWVKYWNDRGYAAIAMDTEGAVPSGNSASKGSIGAVDTDGAYKIENNTPVNIWHPYNHGPQNACFMDGNLAIESQWFYQAVASVIASNSFLRSFPQVDTSRIGITGISYGSYLTSITCAYDSRFACAAPVYGSLGQQDTDTYFGALIRRFYTSTAEIWDDVNTLAQTDTPFLFVTGDKDDYFSVDATAKNAHVMKNARIQYVNAFPHSHGYGSVNAGGHLTTLLSFVDSYCNGGIPLIRVTGNPTTESATTYIEIPSGVSVQSATLYYTTRDHFATDTNSDPWLANEQGYGYYSGLKESATWYTSAVTVSGGTLTASIPSGARYYYILIRDNSSRDVTTEVVAINNKPSYYYPIFNSNTGVEYDWAQDPNGWATKKYATDGGWFTKQLTRSDTTKVDINKYDFDWEYAPGQFMPLTQARYGLDANYYDKVQAISTLEFSGGGMVMNYKAFPIYEDITFWYQYYDSYDAGEQGWYAFALFDNIESGLRIHDGNISAANCGSKLQLRGANHANEAYYNKLFLRKEGTATDDQLSATIAPGTWIKVTISIGDNDTKIYLNGSSTPACTYTTLTRNSFQDSEAYLYVYQSNGVDFQFARRASLDQIYYIGASTNESVDLKNEKLDENGWTTFHRQNATSFVTGANETITNSGRFGSASMRTVDNVTHYEFDTLAYVLNGKNFSVYEDIYFEYNVATPGKTNNGAWYAFGIGDNYNNLFRANNNAFAVSGSSYDSAMIVLSSATTPTDNYGNDCTARYNKFEVYSRTLASSTPSWTVTNSTSSVPIFNNAPGIQCNGYYAWNNEFASVRIRIGDSNTVIFVNGVQIGTYNTKRSDFSSGTCVIGFAAGHAMELNIKMTADDPQVYIGEADGQVLVDTADVNGFSTYIQGSKAKISAYNGKELYAYGRQSAAVTNGYSNLSLAGSGWTVNKTAFDLTKPIRLTYNVKATTADDFITFALFDELTTAYTAGNATWTTDSGYKMNIRMALNSNPEWAGDIDFGNVAITDAQNSVKKIASLGDVNLNTSAQSKDIVIDIIIGAAKSAVVINGVASEFDIKRSDFRNGVAYLSVANYAGAAVTMNAKVAQPTTAVSQTESLTLNSKIVLNDTVALSGMYVSPRVTFTYNLTTAETATVTSFTFSNGNYVFSYSNIGMQYLSKTVTMKLSAKSMDTNAYADISTKTVNVRTYCEGVLASTSDANQKRLIVDFLNYCAAAQQYRNQTVDANANISAYQSYGSKYENLTAPTSILTSDRLYRSDYAGITGAKISLGSSVGLMFDVGIAPSIQSTEYYAEFYMSGTKVATASKANFVSVGTNKFRVTLNGITMTGFDTVIRLEVKNSSGTVITSIEYSINSYIADRMGEMHVSANEIAFLKALYCFGKSAQAL